MREQQPRLAARPIGRRALLAAFALVGFATRSRGGDTEGLAAVAARAGLRFGSAATAASLAEDRLGALIRGQCASLTPELGMKWAALAPTRDDHDWREADAVVRFARAHGLELRGHTLLWHRSVPAWARIEPGAAWASVSAHIRATMARYAADVGEWDVVNEPIVAGGLRDSAFLRAFGPSFVRRALEEASDAAPSARLFVNEYDVEHADAEQSARRAALLRLVRDLVRSGAPLHGVGIQAHLAIGRAPFAAASFRDLLGAFGDLGLSVSITELDVKERDYVLPVSERDQRVAEHAARFLEVALAQPIVRSITTWGLSDRQSWLEVTASDRARFPGAWTDGSSPGLNRGLPYDAALAPKPLRAAIADAFIQRSNMDWRRR